MQLLTRTDFSRLGKVLEECERQLDAFVYFNQAEARIGNIEKNMITLLTQAENVRADLMSLEADLILAIKQKA